MSGDGLLHEVVNGLLSRPDFASIVDAISVGHIPGGSGNGLASAVNAASEEALGVTGAAYLVIKGWTRKLDVYCMTQDGEKPRFGFLSFTW